MKALCVLSLLVVGQEVSNFQSAGAGNNVKRIENNYQHLGEPQQRIMGKRPRRGQFGNQAPDSTTSILANPSPVDTLSAPQRDATHDVFASKSRLTGETLPNGDRDTFSPAKVGVSPEALETAVKPDAKLSLAGVLVSSALL